jgi:hypothetical protein
MTTSSRGPVCWRSRRRVATSANLKPRALVGTGVRPYWRLSSAIASYRRGGVRAESSRAAVRCRRWAAAVNGDVRCISLSTHAPGNPEGRQRRGQSRNGCCCPCAARIMRWRGPLAAQSNYHLGILAAKQRSNQSSESQSRSRLPEAAGRSRLTTRRPMLPA